jgi:hypothetical protein
MKALHTSPEKVLPLSLRHINRAMSHNRIIPTASAKRVFVIHFIIYAIAVIAMVLVHKSQVKANGGWAYPWHAWVIAAWSLGIVGHMCSLWTSYEDPGMMKYEREKTQG